MTRIASGRLGHAGLRNSLLNFGRLRRDRVRYRLSSAAARARVGSRRKSEANECVWHQCAPNRAWHTYGVHDPTMSIRIGGQSKSLRDAFDRLVNYPAKTPAAFDFLGAGEPGLLTAEEVKRTRKVSSRISNAEVDFFVDAATTAPWVEPYADLADAEPGNALFGAMTELYWHFGEVAPKGVSFAKISKVLYVKHPHLYPILDSHIRRGYAPPARALRSQFPELGWRRRTWVAVRRDLIDARSSGVIGELRGLLRGYESDDVKKQQRVRSLDALTDLRLLDICAW